MKYSLIWRHIRKNANPDIGGLDRFSNGKCDNSALVNSFKKIATKCLHSKPLRTTLEGSRKFGRQSLSRSWARFWVFGVEILRNIGPQNLDFWETVFLWVTRAEIEGIPLIRVWIERINGSRGLGIAPKWRYGRLGPFVLRISFFNRAAPTKGLIGVGGMGAALLIHWPPQGPQASRMKLKGWRSMDLRCIHSLMLWCFQAIPVCVK